MRHIAAKFVPRLLASEQKQWHVNVCMGLWEKANEDPTFISRIIMGDESWIYNCDPETKLKLSQWKSPQSPRAKRSRVQKRAFPLFFQREGDCKIWGFHDGDYDDYHLLGDDAVWLL
jgi:hypothetical protein